MSAAAAAAKKKHPTVSLIPAQNKPATLHSSVGTLVKLQRQVCD